MLGAADWGSKGIMGPDWEGGMWGGVGPPPPDMGLEACSWTPMGDGWGDMYPKRQRRNHIIPNLVVGSDLKDRTIIKEKNNRFIFSDTKSLEGVKIP